MNFLARLLYGIIGGLVFVILTPLLLNFAEIEMASRGAAEKAFLYGCVWADKAFSAEQIVVHGRECELASREYRKALDRFLGKPGE